jgi:hypothetical protein
VSILLSLAVGANATDLRGPDFDGDGREDAAISAPWSNDAGHWRSGAVHLMYGSDSGLFPPGDGRTVALARSAPASGDSFGQALAWGDFDGDCFDDLAVGVPDATVGGVADAGGVQVFYGGSDGPAAAGAAWFDRNTAGIALGPELEGRFGLTLAAGDFDGDGRDDLAIGAPSDTSFPGCCYDDGDGEVHVLYGAQEVGLEGSGSQLVTDAPDQQFGAALATGDFNCDGFDDLAIDELSSAWEWADVLEPFPVYHLEGKVLVFYGSAHGLDDALPIAAQAWTTASPGFLDTMPSTATLGSRGQHDLPGITLIAGNFDGNTSGGRDCDDLAIGIPLQKVSNVAGAGAVAVLYGTAAAGLQATAPADDAWTPSDLGFPLAANDRFGWTLTTGRFDGDPYEDLAVASRASGAGSLTVFRGTTQGLVSIGATRWDRGSTEVPGELMDGDALGQGLGAGDFDGDGTTDLLVGLPGSRLGAVAEGGIAAVLLLDDDLLPAVVGATAWSTDDLGGVASSYEHFGEVVTRPRRAPSCGGGWGGPGGIGG